MAELFNCIPGRAMASALVLAFFVGSIALAAALGFIAGRIVRKGDGPRP